MQIVILAGGIGGSRFVSGVRHAYPEASIVVVVNTADDITLHGLRICPDLDTVMYTLGGGIDRDRGWGRTDETWHARDELTAYGAEPSWFGLGDKDLATHLIRTQMLDGGYTLTDVTAALCARWIDDPLIRIIPMSDDRVESHVVIEEAAEPSGRRVVHFQEYWVRLRAEPDALTVLQVGIDRAKAAPGVVEAMAGADLILVAPSNPVVSIGPILAVSDLRAALAEAPAPIIGFSPILHGAPVLGMAHRLLPAIGVEVSAAAVGEHYGARPLGGLLDLWVMETGEPPETERLTASGLATLRHPLLMTNPPTTASFVVAAVAAQRQQTPARRSAPPQSAP